MYSLSRVSNAETHFSKTSSINENREWTVGVSKKQHEQSGKAEKERNKSGGSIQDNKPGLAVSPEKAELNTDNDSKTEKIKSGHDESGQPKDEELISGTPEEMQQGNEDDEDDEEEEGPQPIGTSLLMVKVNFRP